MDRPLETYPFTATCASFGALHRLIPPRTPQLNGRVERGHQTDEQEFYRRPPYRTRTQLEGGLLAVALAVQSPAAP